MVCPNLEEPLAAVLRKTAGAGGKAKGRTGPLAPCAGEAQMWLRPVGRECDGVS